MLTVNETLRTQIEKVAAKNKPEPFHVSGRGHLASNLHPNALKVTVRRGAPAAVPVASGEMPNTEPIDDQTLSVRRQRPL